MSQLTAEVLEGFTNSVLRKGFDNATQTPDFHKTIWEYCCSKDAFVAIAAPRAHAKSTVVTHAYTLACLLFRERDYAILVSETVAQSVQFLGDIKKELLDNEDLRELFGIGRLIKDTEDDLICEMEDGHKFRVQAKGAEQKVRGLKWKAKRPNLIICHEEGTDIYTPETGWIKNQDYPEARRLYTHQAYEIEFEDGTKEIVSSEHRYLVGDKGWQYPWQMQSGSDVMQNVNNDMLDLILRKERHLVKPIASLLKVKQRLLSGTRQMLIFLLLQEKNGTWITKNWFFKRLKLLLKQTLLGRQVIVPNEERRNSKQCLLG